MLTDVAAKRAQAREKPWRLADRDGLHLLIQPSGTKLWQGRYRIDKKERTASYGKYPDVSLAEARQKHAEARKIIAQGLDPIVAKRARQIARAQQKSFEEAARLWHTAWKEPRSGRHVDYVLRRLEADAFPMIGRQGVGQVTAPELVRMLKKVEQRGALDIAKRLYQTCGQIFRYSVAHGWADRNPAADVKPGDVLAARKKKNFARVEVKEFPALMRKVDLYAGNVRTRLAMKLLALTFVRTSELIGAKKDEFDLEAAEWRIPATRMKMRTPHIVPLSQQAVRVVQDLLSIAGPGELLFPGERDHAKPMSNNTILKALERMGYGTHSERHQTGHGFRGIASTVLHEHGWPHEHIELQLAHVRRDQVSAAYNYATYLPQRADMMAWWGQFIEGVGQGKVIPLRRAA